MVLDKGTTIVFILENGDDYEKYLIHEGYSDLIIEVICEHEGDTEYLDSYINRMKGKKRKGGGYRDYTKEGGRQDALVDLCHEHKTEYALPVAKKLVGQADENKRIPSKVKELLSALEGRIGAIKAHILEDEA